MAGLLAVTLKVKLIDLSADPANRPTVPISQPILPFSMLEERVFFELSVSWRSKLRGRIARLAAVKLVRQIDKGLQPFPVGDREELNRAWCELGCHETLRIRCWIRLINKGVNLMSDHAGCKAKVANPKPNAYQ